MNEPEIVEQPKGPVRKETLLTRKGILEFLKREVTVKLPAGWWIAAGAGAIVLLLLALD